MSERKQRTFSYTRPLPFVVFLATAIFCVLPSLAIAQGVPNFKWVYSAFVTINQVAYSRDGKTLAVGGVGWRRYFGQGPGVLAVFNTATGTLIQTLNTAANNPSGSVNAVAFAPDGKTLAVGGVYQIGNNAPQGVLELWNVSTGSLIRSLATSATHVNSVAFTPNGQTVVDGGVGVNSNNHNAGVLELWSVSTGKLTASFPTTASQGVNSVATSPDGKTVADGGLTVNNNNKNIGVLELWNVSTGKLNAPLNTSASNGINAVAFSPNGLTLADGGKGQSTSNQNIGVLELWTVATGKLSASLSSNAAINIRAVAFSPDGTSVVDGGDGSTGGVIDLWTISNGALSNSFTTSANSVYSVAFSPNGVYLADGGTGFDSGVLELWNVATSNLVTTFGYSTSADVDAVAISPDGTLAAIGGLGSQTDSSGNSTISGYIQIWNLANGQLLNTFTSTANNGVLSLAFSPDGKTVAAGGAYRSGGDDVGILELWNISTGKLTASLPTSTAFSVNSVAFSPDGTMVADGGGLQPGIVELWNVSTLKLISSLPVSAESIGSVVFSPDGKTLAVGGGGGGSAVLELWNVATGKQTASLPTTQYGDALAFSPDGSKLVACGGHVEVWKVATNKLLTKFNTSQQGQNISSVAFSPDGKTLFVTDGLLEVFSTTSYSELNYYNQLTQGSDSLAVSPGGQYLIYGCNLDPGGGLSVYQGMVGVAVNPYFVPPTLTSLTLSSSSIVAGGSVTGTVTISSAAPAGGIVVALSSSLPSLVQVPATVTIPQGAISATFTIATASSSTPANVTLTATYGNSSQMANLAVKASSSALQSITVNPTSVLGGRNVVGKVTLTTAAPTGGIQVTLTGANSAVTVPASVTVPAGATSQTFLVQTAAVTATNTVTLTGTYSGVSQTTNLTVQPISLVSISATPSTVEGGIDSFILITLNGPAPQGGVIITLKSSNPTAAALPTSVTIPAGFYLVGVPVSTSLVTANTNVTLSAIYGSVTQTTRLTLTP